MKQPRSAFASSVELRLLVRLRQSSIVGPALDLEEAPEPSSRFPIVPDACAVPTS